MKHTANNRPPDDNKMKKYGIIGGIIAILLIVIIAGSYFYTKGEALHIEMSKLARMLSKEETPVKRIALHERTLNIALAKADKNGYDTYFVGISESETQESILNTLTLLGAKPHHLQTIEFTDMRTRGFSYWIGKYGTYFIWIPLIIILVIVIRNLSSKSQFKTFQWKAPFIDPSTQKNPITFDSVAGIENVKMEVEEVVSFLKNPDRFTKMGAQIPKGILLSGPPGTGKTLLARAVSGEAGVPFGFLSGSNLVEIFVGVAASRVRNVFETAKQRSPAIVFIDELDAIGKKRGTGGFGGHNEQEQALNEILTQMDGFEGNEGVIVIGATNRIDVLDPALLRPGRFDRKIQVPMPAVKEREAILHIHARNIRLSGDTDLRQVAQITSEFSGAELKNLINEAAMLAARENTTDMVEQRHLMQASEKVALGARRSLSLSPEEKRRTAIHEAGHAVVAHFTKEAPPVQRVSIIGRGRTGGHVLATFDKDITAHTKEQIEAMITFVYGSYAAEKEFFGTTATGVQADFKSAEWYAWSMVARFGMSDMGPLWYEEGSMFADPSQQIRPYSEQTKQKIDEAVHKIKVEMLNRAECIIKEHRKKVSLLADKLLEKEVVYREEFLRLMEIDHTQ